MTSLPPGSLYWRGGFVLALALATALACRLAPEPKAGDETGVVMQLPDRIGPLYGHDESVSAAELAILPSDTTFARKTYGPPGASPIERILCSIVLSGQEKRSIHRPERCLPAQGWRIESSRTETVPLASGRQLATTALLLERPITLPDGSSIQLHSYFLYWFVGQNVTTASHTERILLTNWDLLVHRVNQRWAYVTISKVILADLQPGNETADQTLAELKEFIRESVPFYVKTEMPGNGTATALGN